MRSKAPLSGSPVSESSFVHHPSRQDLPHVVLRSSRSTSGRRLSPQSVLLKGRPRGTHVPFVPSALDPCSCSKLSALLLGPPGSKRLMAFGRLCSSRDRGPAAIEIFLTDGRVKPLNRSNSDRPRFLVARWDAMPFAHGLVRHLPMLPLVAPRGVYVPRHLSAGVLTA